MKRIAIVKKPKAEAIENQLIKMAQERKLASQVTEMALIKMLEDWSKEEAKHTGSVQFGRKKYHTYDDDEDDNDDDLL